MGDLLKLASGLLEAGDSATFAAARISTRAWTCPLKPSMMRASSIQQRWSSGVSKSGRSGSCADWPCPVVRLCLAHTRRQSASEVGRLRQNLCSTRARVLPSEPTSSRTDGPSNVPPTRAPQDECPYNMALFGDFLATHPPKDIWMSRQQALKVGRPAARDPGPLRILPQCL